MGMVMLRRVRCWLLGVCALATLGSKCTPKPSVEQARVAGTSASPTATASTPLFEVESAYVALNRARRFSEARSLLQGLAPEQAKLPSYRFVNAYLATQTGDAERALSLLAGGIPELESLTSDIAWIRARAQLQTRDALTGANWLATNGSRESWLDAARTLSRLGAREATLEAIDKGLASLRDRRGYRADATQAEYRWLRVQLQRGSEPAPTDDLRWLALESPWFRPAQADVATAIDASTLPLDATQQLRRLRQLAECGCLERLDSELTRFRPGNPLLSEAAAAYLRGRVRQMARREQVEGANLLARAADLNVDEATRVRIDAARLYVREGQVELAVRQYEHVARQSSERKQEAELYLARALSTLGQLRRGIDQFSRFVTRFTRGTLRRIAENERAYAYLALGEQARAYTELKRLAAASEGRDANPMALQLAGLAASELGNRGAAVEHWQAVVRAAPLTLAAAFASARLRRMNAEVPTSHAELEPGADLPLVRTMAPPLEGELETLPRRVNQLLAFGLDEMAARALRSEPTRSSPKRSNEVESSCREWARIAYGEQGFVSSRKIRGSFDTAERITEASRWRWECRFPRPYAAIVTEFEREFRLPEDLLFAIMRQESGFDPEVVSPAGAVGLMQLLPRTAQRIAEEIQQTGDIRLEEPRTSLRLGAAYFRRLLDFFDQNLVLAIAAYNAGPAAVSLWLKHAGHPSVELFAARIPYAETQKYVERVMANLLVYRHLNKLGRDFDGLSLDLPKDSKDGSGLY